MDTYKILKIIFLLSLFFSQVSAQIEFPQVNEKFVIFRKDTFNLQDINGKINGKGLAIQTDTTKFKVKTVTSESNLTKDTSWNEIKYYAVGLGQFKNGKKQGTWYYSSSRNIDKMDGKLNFVDNEITEIICFNNEDEKNIWLKTKFVDGKLQLYYLDNKKNKFVKKKTGLGMILEMLNVQ